MKFKEKLYKLSDYAILGTFLAIEVLAFISFSFGNSFLFFGILSLVLLIILSLLSLKEIKTDGFMSSMTLIFPLFMFALLTALSNYSVGHNKLGDFNLGQLIFVPLGLLSMGLCGTILSKKKSFKLSTFVLVILSALALLVFINLMVNLVNFDAFYSIKYKGYYMYYSGKRSEVQVSEIAYTLEGFQFIESKMSHYAMYPALLLSSGIMLIYTSYKEHKALFFTYLGFVILGLLALILVPSIIGLLFAIVMCLVTLCIFLINKFKIKISKFKILLYIGLVLGALVVLLMILNNNVSSISNMIANNSLLNRIFNTNRIVTRYNNALRGIFSREKIFGFCAEKLSEYNTVEVHLTGSAFFDSFMTSGIIGVVMLIALFFFGYKGFSKNKYLEVEDKAPFQALLAYIIMFTFICLFFYEGEYGIFKQIYCPIYMTGPFIITIFTMFYMNGRGQSFKGGRL